MKTIAEIRAEHSAKAGTILGRYQDEIGEIKSTKTLPEGAYLDRLTDEQRFGLLREQKAQKAADAHERTLREYAREVDRYHAALSERTDALKGRLFGVSDAGALSRAALADEGELSTLLDVATQAGNGDLARAVFVAAHQKGRATSWRATSTESTPRPAVCTRSCWTPPPPRSSSASGAP